MVALHKGIAQVTGAGTVYPSALDNATRLCHWPLPAEERGWGTKYSVTRLSKHLFAAKLGAPGTWFYTQLLYPSGVRVQHNLTIHCLTLPITDHSQTTKQLYFCSTAAVCLYIQMSLESVLLQLLTYDARQCWEGFKDVLGGPGGWC